MSRSVPTCLAGLPAIDLSNARGQPTGVARLALVTLLAHVNGSTAYPGVKRIADLVGSTQPTTRKALALLQNRNAIERLDGRWHIRLAGEVGRIRVFWPLPSDWRLGDDQTVAFRALRSGIGERNHAAVAMMLYQFARPSDAAGWSPMPPNQAWIARVLGTSEDTVRRAKRNAIARGLATEQRDGLLVFEDPGRWPAILGPGLRLVEDPDEPGEPSNDGGTPRDPGPCEAANDASYSLRPSDAVGYVERELAAAGWALPEDPLALEILTTAFYRVGLAGTLNLLRGELAGPFPSYALEPIGAALGEAYECPYQLIRVRPDLRP